MNPTDQPTLPEREHLAGCPNPPGRTESFPLTRTDGSTVTVTRCQQCGGQAVDLTKEEDHV